MTDVLRRQVIMAREIGLEINQEDIKFTPFLGSDVVEGSVEEFFDKCAAKESEFADLYNKAKSQDRKLRFVAKIENGECFVSLEQVDSSHPFYSLNGTDNAVMIYSDYYKSPLLVQGAGAGGLQTASGVVNEILTINQ